MNNVEAFKNELRNFKFNKTKLATLNKISENVNIAITNKDIDVSSMLLEQFDSELKDNNLKLEETYVNLTGLHAIRYDKEPSSFNPSLSEEVRLELIEKYNYLLKQRKKLLKKAKDKLDNEILRLNSNVSHVENILDRLPKQIGNAVFQIYCNNKRYEDVSNNGYFWNASTLYYNIEKELEKVLDGVE